MKNLAWAVGGLAIVLVLVFIFATKSGNGQDLLIPSQTPVASPKLEFLNQQSEASPLREASKQPTASAMKKTYNQAPPVLSADKISGKKVRIKTAKGDIVFELYADAPIAASNFMFLTSDGFYDGLTFHRREEGFVIQGGDPLGDGRGGPGYKFNDEPVKRDYKKGIVAMANAGPNTNGSQFFIMLADAPSLPKNYTIFGNVVSGIDVVDQIKVGDVMTKVSVE